MIVHVLNSSKVGGPESLVLPALANLRLPHAVVFLLEKRCGERGRRGFEYARSLKIPACEVPVASRFDPAAISNLGRLLTRLGARVTHAHDVKASTYTLLAARFSGVKTALFSTHHGIHGRPDVKTKVYERFYARAVLPWFDRVLAVSSPDHAELVRRGLGEKAQLHLNGLDARYVAPTDRAAVSRRLRKEWGVDETVPLIGIVARLSKEKRHDRALRALASLRQTRPDLPWRLVCFGVGARARELEALAHDIGLTDRVSWMGYRPRIGDEMAGFDLVLSMSDAEGLPLNLVEAGWAGTPVVATAVGGVRDLIASAAEGILVSPSDPPAVIGRAIGTAIENASLRASLGGALQTRVLQRFTQRAWLARLRELYAPFVSEGMMEIAAHA